MLPKSDQFPTLAQDFLNGLKLVVSGWDSQDTPRFIVESIGNATDDSVIRMAEKMILQEEVDLTISFCSVFFLDQLVKIYDAYKKPLIHLDLGGHIYKKEHISPYVVHHSAQLWQTAYAAGVHAATEYGKKGAIASSFYDGGYQLTESFVKGFTEAGGEIVFYYVAPMDYKTETFEDMVNGVAESESDFLYTLFSYKEGVKIFEVLSGSTLNGTLPVLAAPLMTDPILNIKEYGITEVTSLASWSFEEDSPEMNAFMDQFQDRYEKQPDIIALMGYETGLMIRATVLDDGTIKKDIGQYLNETSLASPRGALSFNSYHESQVDSYKIRAFKYNKVRYHNHVIGSLDASFTKELNELFEASPYSGWRNPYICT